MMKLKNFKASMELLKEGQKALNEADINVEDYDDQFLVESTDIAWSFPIVARAIKKRQSKAVILKLQHKQVFQALDGTEIDRGVAKEMNIPVMTFPVSGGGIFGDAGDVFCLLTYKSKKQFNWVGHIKQKIVDMLVKRGIQASLESNDILVEGKKIAGSSINQYFGQTIEIIFFALNDSSEMVRKLTNKERPITGLKKHGIDVNKFYEFLKADILEFFEKQEGGDDLLVSE